MNIHTNVQSLLKELPPGVKVVAAAKGRSSDECRQAIDAGISIIGENYLQETEKIKEEVQRHAEWHFIGHLQRNKVRKAIQMFDMIQSVDSHQLAQAINRHCAQTGTIMPILCEVNIGEEQKKYGVSPEDVEEFLRDISLLKHVRVMGLMTMGPMVQQPDDIRPLFKHARELFFAMKQLAIPRITMRYLSMGMSDNYRVAIQEGANMIRIGTGIFGKLDRRTTC